jgi:transcriptional regulator with PAS, ATPase and Fis domain
MNGTEFLRQVKDLYPHILRIILSGYTDVDSISEAINEGHLYKFFLKPWNDQNLKLEIRQAMDQYDLMQDNKFLHEQVVRQNDELIQVNENLKEMNDHLEEMIRERTLSLEIQNKALQISHAILDDRPVPIIGVSSEQMVVMTNKAAHHHWGDEDPIVLGGNINDFFVPELEKSVMQCISTGERCVLTTESIRGSSFHLELIPLTGIYQGQGIIITLSDNHS